MKKIIIAFALVSGLIACQENKTGTATPQIASSNGSSSFSVDGKEYKGKIETQYFGDKTTGAYSVTCQQDEPLVLLQVTFANEADAGADKKLTPVKNFMRIANGEVNIALSGTGIGEMEYVSVEASGEISVKNRTVTLSNLKLVNQKGEAKTVTATLGF